MQFIQGVILHRKSFTIKKGKNTGKDIPVIEMLDPYPNHSAVVDVTDFDHHLQDCREGDKVTIPVRISTGISQKGNPYINYTSAGAPDEAA
jgi:hypothetical protein